ncbi:MAG: NUDIX domain-containing protein [Bacteroidales bacterium]|nr:NUDIX domain-containing protein [Bacteroidales bacterium]
MSVDFDNEKIIKENRDLFFSDLCSQNFHIHSRIKSAEEMFYSLTSKLYHVFAAGGVVENENGEILFIYRNNYWDLPKGHWEHGESFPFCAKREVSEETGVAGLEIIDFISVSHHTYYMHSRHEIKHIYWYKMRSSVKEKLYPQLEEGITDIRWVGRNELEQVTERTYPNIKHLLEQMKLKNML